MNESLKKLIKSVFNLSDNSFSEDLTRQDISNWDSLRHMDLIASIESEYNTMLDMQEILSIKSLPDIVAVLKGKGIDVES